MSDPATFEALKSTRLASELDDEQCRILAEVVTIREFPKGAVVVREGTSDNHLYVILAGALSVVHKHGKADAETLFCLDTGDFVGELGFIDGTKHYASLVALEATRVLSLERQALERLLADSPAVVYRVMRSIVRTVHEIQRRLSMQSVELTNYIYKQHGKY
jgi:CRP/FNR family transcriptional regulator, cyclic AMP receptor protein